MSATPEQLERLKPYIAGGQPDARGEVDMYCPLHNDTRRSASLNIQMGAWYCHAGCGGGSVRQLIDAEEAWVPPTGRVRAASPSVPARIDLSAPEQVTKQDVKRWHRRLMNEPDALGWLLRERGLTADTARRARLGWDGRYFKIPIWSPERELWNVRTYDPRPLDTRRKIWSVRGMGRARLYPIGRAVASEPGEAILFTEGEWDALLASQWGYLAITRTDGAGKPWRPEWNEYFWDRRVYIVQDADVAGLGAAGTIAQALAPLARQVAVVQLPYDLKEKEGRDLTDFLLEQSEPGLALGELMMEALPVEVNR